MNSFILPLFLAPALQAAPAEPGNPLSMLIPVVLMIAIFYFLMIRPQNKKRKETEKMLAALKKGDKVITIGGLHGTVQNTKDTTVILKVDDNVKLEFLRSAISNVVTASKEEKKEEKDEPEEKSEDTQAGE